METLAWLLAYVVGFGLLQLLLYRYLRHDPAPDATPGLADRAAPAAARSSDDAGHYCRHCGAYNESHATFAYCRECVGRLS